MDLLAFHPAQVYPVGIGATIYQQACHVEGFVQGCPVQGCPAVFVRRIDLCTTVYQQACHVEGVVQGCPVQVLSELSAHPRKSPIFAVTEAVSPECANTNGG